MTPLQFLSSITAMLLSLPTILHCYSINFSTHLLNENEQEVTVQFNVDPKEWIYTDLITFSADNPSVTLTPFKAHNDAVTRYDEAFKKTKKVFDQPTTLTLNVHKKGLVPADVYLHVTATSNQKGPEEHLLKLWTKSKTKAKESDTERHESQQTSLSELPKTVPLVQGTQNQVDENRFTGLFYWTRYLSNLVTTIQSPFVRLLLVLLLGILLSLTPCIYPMIPITIGILQTGSESSFIRNFLRALAYTCGIATTFALFGLLASCTGPLCGQLLMQPLFIIVLIIILSYLGLSMFGLYDMYIPKLFNLSASATKQPQSLLSSFMFGAASGTIASPCVSPGLALLLSIVATLGNKIMGFLLLFVFGIGLSTPLLIVGTFSSSLNLLPRAGMWMIEIKKVFGFIIFGMCFYYVSYIISMTTLLWFIASFVTCSGLYYIYFGQGLASSFWRKLNTILGIALIITSIILFFHAYRAVTYGSHDILQDDRWHSDYDTAFKQAQREHKKLFIDFWATFCPTCLAINKTVLTRPTIIHALQHFVLLKVDGTYSSNKPYHFLKEKFLITGFPTFVIVDPTTEIILKTWGGELYTVPEHLFIAELELFY